MKVLGFQQGTSTLNTSTASTNRQVTPVVTAETTGTTTDLPRHPAMPIGSGSRPRTVTTTAPKTTPKSNPNPAIPCVTPEFFNAIINASKKWRVRDVTRIVQSLNLGHHFVTHGTELLPATKLLERINPLLFATEVKEVVWHGGPNCRAKLHSNLAHWLLDNLMWEVRLKAKDAKDGSSGHTLKAKILSIL